MPAEASVSLKNTTGKEFNLNLPDGTTIAYSIDRLCWDKTDKGKLQEITTDFPGPDSNACPIGTSRINPEWGFWDHLEEWFTGLFD